MTIQNELVRIAMSEVGVREIGGNNTGPRIAEYQRATWLNPGPWPWCAAFCSYILLHALRTPDGAAYLSGRNRGEGPEAFRCRDASAFGWLHWAGARGGMLMFDENSGIAPAAGDLVVYDFSHIGIVTTYDPDFRVIHCVEGNTNGRGERDSESGDGVWEKVRSVSLVRSYIRL